MSRDERKRDRKYKEKKADKLRLSQDEELADANDGGQVHQVQVQQEHQVHQVQVQQEHHPDNGSNNSEEVEHIKYDSDFNLLD